MSGNHPLALPRFFAASLLLAFLCHAPASAKTPAQSTTTQAAVASAHHAGKMPALQFPATTQAAIASAHPLATAAGHQILRQGGNAFDAAVAVGAALAVVEPHSSGLGGGGFWLLHRAADGRQIMLDGRETAPGLATADMYLDEKGIPVAGASLDGAKAAAIPGIPAALAHLARHYGKLPLKQTLAPAIYLAAAGFEVDARLAASLQSHRDKLRRDPRAAALFLPDGEPLTAVQTLRQPQLAHTLGALANQGRDGFYRGPTAAAMVESVQKAGGIWRMQDLAAYRVIEREPIKFTYRGANITAAALPSSGGLALAHSLNTLAHFQPAKVSQGENAHRVVQAMRGAFRDRNTHLGDADFVAVALEPFISLNAARVRAAQIDSPAMPPTTLPKLDSKNAETPGGAQTTHFSIIDKDGNRVAATLSLNTFFDSGFIAGNSGVLLNNEMDDFTIHPGAANAYGLQGGSANVIAPGKRPLSSMSPTFVEDEKGVLILGTPGGSRIISMMLLAILRYVDEAETDMQKIVSSPRYHHQHLPDEVRIEPRGFSADWVEALRARGHQVKETEREWGNMQAVFADKLTGKTTAASDPRGASATRY